MLSYHTHYTDEKTKHRYEVTCQLVVSTFESRWIRSKAHVILPLKDLIKLEVSARFT